MRSQRPAACPRSRWGCGTTSATIDRGRRNGRSAGEHSTSASPTSIWRTTTGRRMARPSRTSAGSSPPTSPAHRDELVISTKAGYDMWPGPYGDLGSRKYLLASLDQSLRAHGPRLRRHLLLAPRRSRHTRWRRRSARWRRQCTRARRCTSASRRTPRTAPRMAAAARRAATFRC